MVIRKAQIEDGLGIFEFLEKRKENHGRSESEFLKDFKNHQEDRLACGLLAEGTGAIKGILFGHFRESFCYGGTALVIDALIGEGRVKDALLDGVEDWFEGEYSSVKRVIQAEIHG